MRAKTIHLIALSAFIFALAARAEDAPSIVVGTSFTKAGNQARNAREQLQGLQLWADEINSRGGLLGRKVRLSYQDDGGDAQTVAAVYDKLVVEEKAEILVGPYSPEMTPPAAAITEQHGVPLLVTTVTTASLWERGYKGVFGLLTMAGASVDPVLEFAKRKGLRRVAFVYQQDGFPREFADGVKQRLLMAGMRTVVDAPYSGELADFASIVGQLKTKRPDVVFVGAYLPDSLSFMQHAKDQKFSANIMAFSGGANLPEFGDGLKRDAEGVLGSTQWEPTLKMTAVGEFARRYKARFGYEPNFVAATGYGAGQVLEAAVKKAATTEPARVRKALYELDITSVLGRYKVDANGRQIGKTGYTVQWINGVRTTVLPREAAGADVLYPFQDWSKR
jgi:branched-chain amino acid transport system substrate-binding protein